MHQEEHKVLFDSYEVLHGFKGFTQNLQYIYRKCAFCSW